jgi:hypothetical protein
MNKSPSITRRIKYIQRYAGILEENCQDLREFFGRERNISFAGA